MPTIDFEGNQQTNTNPGSNADNNPNNSGTGNPANQQDTTNLHGGETTDITGNKPADGSGINTNPNTGGNNNEDTNPDNQPSHDLAEGTEVEFDNVVYKVDDKGNLVNDKGEIFKQANEVKKWLEDNNFSDDNNDDQISIDNIQETIGVTVTDESGNPVEFTNDAKGIKAYIDAVRELQAVEIAQGAINKLYSDNPLLKQFVDYVQLNGTPKGFGEIPDRRGITIDKDNEAQQIAIIKMAASEFGNKSLNDNYINYLKSTGSLFDEAKVQLEALVAKDEQVRKDIEARAADYRKQEEIKNKEYWDGVNKAINERRIGGYLLPETFVKEVNGQKVTYNLADFNAYVSKPTEVDANGDRMTGYMRDLDKLSDKELLERELLDAWLLFTGGSYKDLVNMAIKEEGVRRLVAKSKENKAQRHIKINKPTNSGDKNTLIFE